MAGPWEQYQTTSGPWEAYAAPQEPTKSDAYKQGAKVENPVVRGLLSVINGPTFGFGDEVAGAVGGAIDYTKNFNPFGDRRSSRSMSEIIFGKAPKTFSDYYAENRDYVRGVQDGYKQEFPIGSTLTQVAASAPIMAKNVLGPLLGLSRSVPVMSSVANGTGMLARSAQAGGTAAAYGGLQGVGDSTADNLGGVLGDAGINAVVSAGLGGLGVPVAGAVGAVGGNIRQRVSSSPAAQAMAERYAQYKIAQAAARDGQTTGQMAARLNTLGDEARLVDSGGQSTRQLLDTLAVLPGQTKNQVEQAIRQRQAGRAGRMIESAEQNLNAQGQRLAPNIAAWEQQRYASAAPLYEQLRTINITQPSPGLASAVAAAEELGATKLARQMATAEQVGYSLDSKNPASWSMNDLDLVKRGLDKMISAETDIAGKVSSLGRSYQSLKASLVGELDKATTDPSTGQSLYKMARDAYSGPSAIIDAANLGRNAITRDGATIAGLTAGLSDSEQQAFRLGAFEALRSKLGTQGGQTNIINMWKEPATQEKLKAIFGDERSFRQFAADVAREARLKGLESVGRGSQTAARQFGAGDLDSGAATDAASMVANAKGGNVLGVVGAAKNLWNKVSTPESVRNQMGQILLSQGQTARGNVNSLREILQQIDQQNQIIANRSGLIGSRLAVPLVP